MLKPTFFHNSKIPTSNKFQWLSDEQDLWSNDCQSQSTASFAGKTKPSSPLDSDINTKRQREYTLDESRNSDIMVCEQTPHEGYIPLRLTELTLLKVVQHACEDLRGGFCNKQQDSEQGNYLIEKGQPIVKD